MSPQPPSGSGDGLYVARPIIIAFTIVLAVIVAVLAVITDTAAYGEPQAWIDKADDTVLAPAERADRPLWSPETIAASLWWQVPPAVAAERLSEDERRYRHPNPDVDRWYWQAREAGWPDKSWEWVARVMQCESRGDPNATSPADDRGLLQVNRSSWWRDGRDLGMPADRWSDPIIGLRMGLWVYAQGGSTMWVCWAKVGRPDPDMDRTEALVRFTAAHWP